MILKVTPCDPSNNQGIICEQDPEKIKSFLRSDLVIDFLLTNMVPNFESLK
jgi:hypothetical protein